MVEIHLYGKLRRYTQDMQTNQGGVVWMAPQSDETIESLLTRLGIPIDEVYHIFFNAKLLATHSTMASWLGYQQVCDDPFGWDLSVLVKSGDRIEFFGRDMAALVV